TLMDMVSYEERHNHANGEENRDGHHDNFSWNNGIEGATDDAEVIERRRRDVMALLSTLFASRGTIMLGMGDEAGRSQGGNNNAYCQDNVITWLDWAELDEGLVEHTARLARLRRRFSAFSETRFFAETGDDIGWFNSFGEAMTQDDWGNPEASVLTVALKTLDHDTGRTACIAAIFNRSQTDQAVTLPDGSWRRIDDDIPWRGEAAARSVTFCIAD
ncbi:MAG TPA: glycogen debranching enzyme GlgX, partial [Pseudorhizobium sp.]|nr:glycogen debranching enzyme GlgX [Pseudorhizobium sp.]